MRSHPGEVRTSRFVGWVEARNPTTTQRPEGRTQSLKKYCYDMHILLSQSSDMSILKNIRNIKRVVKVVELVATAGAVLTTGGLAAIPFVLARTLKEATETVAEEGVIELIQVAALEIADNADAITDMVEEVDLGELLENASENDYLVRIGEKLKVLEKDEVTKLLNEQLPFNELLLTDTVFSAAAIGSKLVNARAVKVETNVKRKENFNSLMSFAENLVRDTPLSELKREKSREILRQISQLEEPYGSYAISWFLGKDLKHGKAEGTQAILSQVEKELLVYYGINVNDPSPLFSPV